MATEIPAAPETATAPAATAISAAVPVVQLAVSAVPSAVPVIAAPNPAAFPAVLNLGEGKLSSKGLSCMFCRGTPITGIVPALALGAAAELLVKVSSL